MELSPPPCVIEGDRISLASAVSPVRSTISQRIESRTTFWIALATLLATAVKAAIAWNTIGTNDVVTFYRFAESLQNHGLEWTYAHNIAFNHPPLTAYFLIGIYKLSQLPVLQESAVSFPFLLRLPGIIADVIVVWVVVRIAKLMEDKIPAWALIVFALSPVSLMVTGFHGNTDPIMVMFLAIAVLAAIRDKSILCGFFFALACQIKIIPLLFLPIFFFYWMQRRMTLRFVIPIALTFLGLWSQPLFHFPIVFAKNVLSYGSFWGIWGVTYWLRQTGLSEFARVTYLNFTSAQSVVGAVLKLLIVAAVFLIAWRRRCLMSRELVRSIAYAWMVFFVFSPGVCVQYMVWLVPFVLLLSPAFYGWLTAASTLFVFFFYNVTANGLPWYIAVSTNKLNTVWAPWSLWPWAVLIAGLFYFWRRATETDPTLRLLSVETLPAERSD